MTTINSDDNTQNVVQITAKKPSVKQKLIAMNGSQEGLPVFKNWHSIVTADNQEIKIALSQNALCDQFLKLMPECITVNDTLHIVRGSVIKPLPSAKKLSVAIRRTWSFTICALSSKIQIPPSLPGSMPAINIYVPLIMVSWEDDT